MQISHYPRSCKYFRHSHWFGEKKTNHRLLCIWKFGNDKNIYLCHFKCFVYNMCFPLNNMHKHMHCVLHIRRLHVCVMRCNEKSNCATVLNNKLNNTITLVWCSIKFNLISISDLKCICINFISYTIFDDLLWTRNARVHGSRFTIFNL